MNQTIRNELNLWEHLNHYGIRHFSDEDNYSSKEICMSRNERIHKPIHGIADEVLDQIKENEPYHLDRWVPAAEVKNQLELDFVSASVVSRRYGTRGWLFAIVVRILEDEGRLEYKMAGDRAYYRTI